MCTSLLAFVHMTLSRRLPSPAVLIRSIRNFGRLRDFSSAIGVEFGVMAASFLTLRLAATNWGATGFGEFVLFRRSIGLLQLPLSLSLGLGVARYVAVERASGRSERDYGVAAVAIATGTVALASIALLLVPEEASMLLFGDSRYSALVGGLACAVAAAVLHAVAYGVFRGQQDFVRANVLQVLAVGCVPLGVLALGHGTVVQSAYGIGAAWGAISLVAIVSGLRNASGTLTLEGVRSALTTLLKYGLPRVPGEFALSAVFALPVIVLAQRDGVQSAGQLGFGITLVSLASSGFAPIGMFVLPQVASRMAKGDLSGVRRDVVQLLGLCIAAAAFATALLWFMAPMVVHLGLGADFSSAIPLVRLAIGCVVPYVIYVVLRSVLDALSAWPHNARNLVLSVACFVGTVESFPGKASVPIAMNISVAVLAALSVIDTWRVLSRSGEASVA